MWPGQYWPLILRLGRFAFGLADPVSRLCLKPYAQKECDAPQNRRYERSFLIADKQKIDGDPREDHRNNLKDRIYLHSVLISSFAISAADICLFCARPKRRPSKHDGRPTNNARGSAPT